MPGTEQPDIPIWAAAKARKQIDVLREVAKTLEEVERERAARPIAQLTESELEAEQLRLDEMLQSNTLTVDGFRRLREVDYYLDGMRQRRSYGPNREEWGYESPNE